MTARRAGNVATAWFGVALLCMSCALGGCAKGDFGRDRPSLIDDDLRDHLRSWTGTMTALGGDAPDARFPLTDDERVLRELAYPLIAPPYERPRWYGFLNLYGAGRIFRQDWSRFDEQAYTRALMGESLRSEAARYARLGDDIRNDRVRVPVFFLLAGRVIEMDRRRELNLDAVSYPSTPNEFAAIGRNAENALVISWVQWSLMARMVSYRLALERLAVASPMPAATEVERSLTALQNLIARYRLLPGPDFTPGPGVVPPPPYGGPVLGANGLPVRDSAARTAAAPTVRPIY